MQNKSRAFTLIELLVVVLIIGILAAVAVPQYQKAVDKARFLQVMLIGEKIRQAQQLYRLANGKYADTAGELGADVPGGYTVKAHSGSEGVLVWDNKFYCHTNSNSYVYCWFYKPSVGFTTDIKNHRKCVLCRSSNPGSDLSRAENMCKAVSGQSTLPSGNCIEVDIP